MRSTLGNMSPLKHPLIWSMALLLAVFSGLPSALEAAAIPSFPGAEGAGGMTPGGRGGRIIPVTNLQDSGPGSFRAAVEAGGPRIVVFRTSGRIELESPVEINHPYLTIAGQSAPGDGICISGETVTVNAEHVIIRYLRFRRGNLERADDALNAVHSPGNIIIDHCSFSWGLDENVSFYRYMKPDGEGGHEKNPIENVTIQWCISSEGLNLHDHAFGATWGGRNVSFHHNLFANNTGRIPSIGWGDHVDFRNNVLFNWRHRNIDGGDSSSMINVVGNVFKSGPATYPGELKYRIAKPEVFRTFNERDQDGRWYIARNFVFAYPGVSSDNWGGGVQFEESVPPEAVAKYIEKGRQFEPVPVVSPVREDPARTAYERVLEHAGATLPVRDPVDRRIVREVRSGDTTFGNGIINTPADVGGWPEYRSLPAPVDDDHDGMADAWERRHGLDASDPADYVDDPDGDGYLNIEEYLNGTDPHRFVDYTLPENNTFSIGGPVTVHTLEDKAYHVDFFNAMEEERVRNLIPNKDAWDWMLENIPFFECPDPVVEEMYYYRWWALRKHLKRVGDYFAYTEFIELDTKASFIPPERTIASALGHHFMETRWLRDQTWDDSYLQYWISGNNGKPQPHFHRYSSWLMDALLKRTRVTGDWEGLRELYPFLVTDYHRWQEEHQLESGLYWQYDVWDAMEESVSGSRHEKNLRPTINSYMYGNAKAMSEIARLAGDTQGADAFQKEAETLRGKVLQTLWNPDHQFFEVVHEDGSFAEVREAIGFIPWYFGLPTDKDHFSTAWEQLIDPEGFWAPFGITTAERRHPEFRSHGVGTCEWDGAVWPYATSQTLVALANLLQEYEHAPLTRRDYADAFLTYTLAQYYDGLPYIGEYQDEVTGQWLKGKHPRSFYYHHSTYADLLITGLAGFRPRSDNRLVVNPLIPEEHWDWFKLDRLPYRGHELTILWDRDGSRYGQGRGLHLFVDGEKAATASTMKEISASLPR